MAGRAADAEALIRRLGTEPPRDARMCDLLAELLVEQGDLTGALTWATAGVQLCLGTNPSPVAAGPAGPDRAPGATHDRGTASENRTAGENGAAADAAAERPRASVPRPLGGGPGARPDDTELRLLLSLRFRIRNDLGLPEDEYDRLLDKLPLGRRPGGSR
jgi:hypothetical protein